jgi:hypothetical protein
MRNALIAVYILFVLTLAAVARAETASVTELCGNDPYIVRTDEFREVVVCLPKIEKKNLNLVNGPRSTEESRFANHGAAGPLHSAAAIEASWNELETSEVN